jgi:hypothetical protein
MLPEITSFLAPDVFGEAARRESGAPFHGVFIARYVDALGVDDVATVLLTDEQQAMGVERGEQIEVAGTAWQVRAIRRDGAGAVRLYLQAAPA